MRKILYRFKNNLKKNNLLKTILFFFLIISSFSSFIFTFIFYVYPKSSLGSEYVQGAEYIYKVDHSLSNQESKKKKAVDSAKSISDYLDGFGLKDIKVNPEYSLENDDIYARIQIPGIKSDLELDKIANMISDKPSLTFTDYYGNPLFDSNKSFESSLRIRSIFGIAADSFLHGNIEDYNFSENSNAPIKVNSARPSYNQNGQSIVQVQLDEEYESQWSSVISYISTFKEEKQKVVLAWLNLDDYINKAKRDYPEEWEKSGKNPYDFSFVGEKAYVEEKTDDKEENKVVKENILKKYQFNARDWLLSNNSSDKLISRNEFNKPVIALQGENSNDYTQEVSGRINFGTTNFALNIHSSSYFLAKYGHLDFIKILIWFGIFLIVITAFFLWYFGIAGIVVSAMTGLFMTIVLSLFIFLGGSITSLVFSAIIISSIFFVALNLIFITNFKNKVYYERNVKNAFRSSALQTRTSFFAFLITLFIFGMITFYVLDKSFISISIIINLTMIFAFAISFWLSKFLIYLLINSTLFKGAENFNNKLLKLEKNRNKKINGIIDQINLNPRKTPLISITTFVVISIITIGILSVFFGQYLFNSSNGFFGQNVLEIRSSFNSPIDDSEIRAIIGVLERFGINRNHINAIPNFAFGNNGSFYNKFTKIQGFTNGDIDVENLLDELNSLGLPHTFVAYFGYQTPFISYSIITNITIALSALIVAGFIYAFFTFGWGSGLSLLLSVLLEIGLLISIVFISRIPLNENVLSIPIFIVLYSLQEKIILFKNFKIEKKEYQNSIYQENKLVNSFTDSLKYTMKKNAMVLLFSTFIFMSIWIFSGTNMLFPLLIWTLGLIFIFFLNYFVLPYFIIKFENINNDRKEKRIKLNYWHVSEFEENIIEGINDYNV